MAFLQGVEIEIPAGVRGTTPDLHIAGRLVSTWDGGAIDLGIVVAPSGRHVTGLFVTNDLWTGEADELWYRWAGPEVTPGAPTFDEIITPGITIPSEAGYSLYLSNADWSTGGVVWAITAGAWVGGVTPTLTGSIRASRVRYKRP